jgi:hypothetical protein
MSVYVQQLMRMAEQEQARRDEERRARQEAEKERLAPLQERLRRLLQQIPDEAQREGLSLMALQAQLRARGRGHMRCHVGELGEALRKLGFRRERRWRSDARFSAVWRKEI